MIVVYIMFFSLFIFLSCCERERSTEAVKKTTLDQFI